VKRTIIFLGIIYLTSIVSGQVLSDYKFVKTWQISETFGEVDSIDVDTVHINYHLDNLIDRF
jgi:hypothetical protein